VHEEMLWVKEAFTLVELQSASCYTILFWIYFLHRSFTSFHKNYFI